MAEMMARLKGSLNTDYEQARGAILAKIRAYLIQLSSDKPSFSKLASAAGVSIPTLRHYFPSRPDAVAAVMDEIGQTGKPYLAVVAEPSDTLANSLETVAAMIVSGIKQGQTGRIHSLGLTEGLGDPVVGPAYLNAILEPTLQAFEARLTVHQERGQMIAVSPRFAALNFIAPLLLASLHQDRLGGCDVRRLDLDALASVQIETFLCAYAVSSDQKRDAP